MAGYCIMAGLPSLLGISGGCEAHCNVQVSRTGSVGTEDQKNHARRVFVRVWSRLGHPPRLLVLIGGDWWLTKTTAS